MLKIVLVGGLLVVASLAFAGTASAVCSETQSPVPYGGSYVCVLDYQSYDDGVTSYTSNTPLRVGGYQSLNDNVWASLNFGANQGDYKTSWGSTTIAGFGTNVGGSLYSMLASASFGFYQNEQETTWDTGSYQSRDTSFGVGAEDPNYDRIANAGVGQQEQKFNSGTCCPPYKGTFITFGAGPGRDRYTLAFTSHDNQPCEMELRGPSGTTSLGPCPADIPSFPDFPTFPHVPS